MSRTTGNPNRLLFVKCSVALLFVATVIYQFSAQTWGSQDILNRAKKTKRFEFTYTDYAHRGNIISSDGKVFAQDEDTRQLTVEFDKVPQSRAFFMDLSMATGIAATEFEQLDVSGTKVRVWYKPMSREQSDAIQELKHKWRVDGISLERTGRRTYSLAESASGFIGAVRDRIPQSGLERSQDKLLAGKNGQTTGLVDRSGAFLPMRQSGKSTKAIEGKNITLTIDSVLQVAASDAVRKAVEANNATSGVAVVIDPKTGDILAMANWPSYDPTTKAQVFNPCYTAQLEPGSTFKILTIAKAFDAHAITMSSTVNCTGSLRVTKKHFVRCPAHRGSSAHGVVNPELAIAKSCNIAAATWARAIGYTSMIAYIKSLGLLSRSDLGLPFEKSGHYFSKDPSKVLQLANLGFGQSLTVTPVLLASAFSMIGNGGVRMQPRIIKKIGDEEQALAPKQKIISPEAAQLTMNCMEAVFSSKYGTGAKLRIPGYKLAGKTGTAQKLNAQTIKTGAKLYVANFVGFVPYRNPRAMILVMVDNPKAGKYYGAEVAGPVFVEIAKAVIHRYGIPPTEAITHESKPKKPAQIEPIED